VEPVITRQECAATVLGGPTAVLDLGGLRIVSDPTFDDPGPHGYLTKTAGPAVTEDQLGPVDLVLVSHDNHPDNLDDRGRAPARRRRADRDRRPRRARPGGRRT
jgi:L-ascorbate metabolism protein UlaG (beta-lactamase superfamily)